MSFKFYLFIAFSQRWLATPQEVLQADWQDVWQAPHPPCFAVSISLRVLSVTILFIMNNSSAISLVYLAALNYRSNNFGCIAIKKVTPKRTVSIPHMWST